MNVCFWCCLRQIITLEPRTFCTSHYCKQFTNNLLYLPNLESLQISLHVLHSDCVCKSSYHSLEKGLFLTFNEHISIFLTIHKITSVASEKHPYVYWPLNALYINLFYALGKINSINFWLHELFNSAVKYDKNITQLHRKWIFIRYFSTLPKSLIIFLEFFIFLLYYVTKLLETLIFVPYLL